MYKLLLSLFLLIFSGCEGILFHPDHQVYRTPDYYQLRYNEIDFRSKDGTRLHGWWLKPEKVSKGLMVVAHGNAQNITAHFTGWVWLVEAGYELFIFDYQGYGASEGEVDMGKAIDDTEAALKYAQANYDGDRFACGQSLGGVLLINVLAKEPYPAYRFVIIDSAFSDLEEIGKEVLSRSYLTWPFQWMAYPTLTEKYNPVDKLARVERPLLFIAGSADEVVPANHSWQLFDAAKRPKEFWLVPGAGHISALNVKEIQKALLEYMEHVPDLSAPSTLKIFDNLDKITKNKE